MSFCSTRRAMPTLGLNIEGKSGYRAQGLVAAVVQGDKSPVHHQLHEQRKIPVTLKPYTCGATAEGARPLLALMIEQEKAWKRPMRFTRSFETPRF